MFFKKKKKIKKQQALFAEAISEVHIKFGDDDLRIDHPSAKCYYKTEEYPLIFPLRFLRKCRQLDYAKMYDFCFRGLYTSKRDWVNGFASKDSRITFTDNGRKIAKDHFDNQYYQEMANSRFTLCPQGDFKWTYRFFEAILCRSIPIIEPGSDHEQCHGFIYFYSDKTSEELLKAWKEIYLEKNYRLFLSRHTLLDRFIFLNTNDHQKLE
jgi:hypothetical protein